MAMVEVTCGLAVGGRSNAAAQHPKARGLPEKPRWIQKKQKSQSPQVARPHHSTTHLLARRPATATY
eukprot:scaffold22970_cov57-Cyclotella_meneghiniana.AAC.1